MVILDVYPAQVETPNQGVIGPIRAVVDGDRSRLLLFDVGPTLIDIIQLVDVTDSIPLRGNAVVLTGPNGDTWRVIRAQGQGGCCGSPGARLRQIPKGSLLAMVP